MANCPKCGTEISDTAKFCRKCGTRIEVFEEPVVDEDGNIQFDWNQPVEIEEKNDDDGRSYDWGPPMGSESQDGTDGSIVPVQYEERYENTEETVMPEWDHTAEFEEDDISENRAMAMAAYVLGPIGVVIAMIASKNSPFAGFHMRQGLKICIIEGLIGILMVLLCWTFIVPAAASIALIVLMVIRIIAFVSVCRGRATEPPIIRNIGFLK